jgi:hypothetical protein
MEVVRSPRAQLDLAHSNRVSGRVRMRAPVRADRGAKLRTAQPTLLELSLVDALGAIC